MGMLIYLLIGMVFSWTSYVRYDGIDQRAILTPFIFLTLLLWPLLVLHILWHAKRLKWRGKVIWERGR